MALFGKLVAPDAFYAEIPDFHYEIYACLVNKDIRRLAIAAPRGHSKTMVVTKINVLHKILHKESHEILPIVIISESETQSIDFLYDIKTLLQESQLIKDVYETVWGCKFGEEGARKWTETQIILPNKVKVVGKGTGQKIRGINYLNVRPRLIILDDFESEHNTDTPESVIKNRKWVTGAVIPALADDGRIIVVGNMVADDCFLSWVKDNRGWKVLWYSAINSDWTTPLWKERYPVHRLKEIRKYDYDDMDNPFGFWREYMNEAVPPDERSIMPRDIRYINQENGRFEWIDDVPCMVFPGKDNEEDIRPGNIFIGIDPATGVNKDKGDYYVRMVILIDKMRNVYVIEYRRERFEVVEQADDIIESFLKYRGRARRVTIETIAYQESLRSLVRSKCSEKKLYLPGIEKGVKPRQGKDSRHDKIVGIAKTGRLYIYQSMEALKTELLTIHRTKRSPDCLDALWNALYHSYPYGGDKVERNKKPDDDYEEVSIDKQDEWLVL